MSQVVADPPQRAAPPAPSVSAAPTSLDAESTAWVASFFVHLALLGLLALASWTLPGRRPDLGLQYEPLDLTDPELSEEFASTDEVFEDIGALGAGEGDSALAVAAEFSLDSLTAIQPELTTVPAETVSLDLPTEMVVATELSELAPVQGIGSVGTTAAEGAIDRITHEILASLAQRPTLVVWMFDQSGSMRAERAGVLKRFRRIYEELGVIEAADNPAFRRHEDKPLLTAVIGFDAEPHRLTAEPTDDFATIEAAIRGITDSTTQVENVFTAVTMTAEKYRRYRTPRNGGRNVMIVMFTDESGDDPDMLDEAVDVCRKSAISVYVVGRPAPFGREYARVKWVDPDPNFDQRPQWPPVRLGPESLMPERLKLSFADNRDRGELEELLDSGFGPYALTRLCCETSGLYFTVHPNRVVGRAVRPGEIEPLAARFARFFDPDVMQRYQPEYVSLANYERLVTSNRARRALVEAARLSWTSPMQDVRLRFPRRDEAELAQLLSQAQQSAAVLQPKIDRIVQTLAAGADDRARLTEPRWRAGYDLAVGRALATQVRTAGYNAMLARAKQGMEFEDPRNNTWVLGRGDDYANSVLEKTAATARESLQRVVDEHPGTPWAHLAARELQTPLGWHWREDYTRLPDRQASGNRPPRPRPEQRPPQGPPRRDPPPL